MCGFPSVSPQGLLADTDSATLTATLLQGLRNLSGKDTPCLRAGSVQIPSSPTTPNQSPNSKGRKLANAEFRCFIYSAARGLPFPNWAPESGFSNPSVRIHMSSGFKVSCKSMCTVMCSWSLLVMCSFFTFLEPRTAPCKRSHNVICFPCLLLSHFACDSSIHPCFWALKYTLPSIHRPTGTTDAHTSRCVFSRERNRSTRQS